MKKTILTLFAVAIASVSMLAQEPQGGNAPKKTPEERADRMTKKLTTELALTPDQQAKIKAVILKREQDKEQEMKTDKADKEKMEADIKSILTPEQYQTFEQKKAEHKQHHKGNQTPPPPPAEK